MREERVRAGAMMAVYTMVYVAAIAVLLLDMLVWRPW